MKVYGLPKELEATIPVNDYANESYDEWMENEAKHKKTIKAWLLTHGYKGKHTGKLLQMPIADGYAEYMLADGSPSMLLHLPYGDAWESPDVQFLPKKEVLRRIKGREDVAKMFGRVS
jgi:hypothetical protein